MSEKQQTRREFIKKATYVAPVIFTLSVTPSLASAASATSKTSASSKDGPIREAAKKIEGLKLESHYKLVRK